MESYWDQSWEAVSPERIRAYVKGFDLQPDAMIRELQAHKSKDVCDAGCGCGIYSLLLAKAGFAVSGFDIAEGAVRIARELLSDAGLPSDLKCASVLSTGYADERFDGVICRDVLDHMRKADAVSAIAELLRITKPGGLVLLTLDTLDDEYQTESHVVNEDGDYVFTDGKWNGMVFHPYTDTEISQILPCNTVCRIRHGADGFTVLLEKRP